MRSRAPIGVVLLLLGLLSGLLTGCSSDEPDAGPTTPADPTSTTSSVTPSTPATSSTPSEPVSESATPATGPQLTTKYLETPVLRVRLPEAATWRIQPGGDSAAANNADGDFVDVATSATQTAQGKSLGFYAQIAVNGGKDPLYPNLKRVQGREVAGVPGFVAEGSTSDSFSYVFGTVYEDAFVTVALKFPKVDAEARDWIESTLASAEWL